MSRCHHCGHNPDAGRRLKRVHFWLTVGWGIVLVLAVIGLWWPPLKPLLSLGFVSLCSIYALAATHWGGYQGGRAEAEASSG